jgi:BMFP domain-containing protein YqiC
MADQNPLFDDMAKLMTGALGAAQSAGEEARTAMRAQADRMIANMDLASREEVEALKALARTALERVETLETRVAELEGREAG